MIQYAAELKGASVKAGRRLIPDNVNLKIKNGEFIAVLGPNGAGKTTLIKAFLGFNKLSYQFTFDLKKFFVISSLAGAAGGCGGVAIAFAFNLPVSATAVVFMTVLYFISVFVSPKRIKYGA